MHSLCDEISKLSPDESNLSYSTDYDKEPEVTSEIPVYLLNDLETLVNEAKAGSLVALDIDETLIMTRNSPSFLLTHSGTKMFNNYVNQRFTDFPTRTYHYRKIGEALKDKVTVTPSTACAVRSLQDQGCYVFGVTARYREYAPMTERTLFNLGINLNLNCPFPKQAMVNEADDTLCQNGIIYCSSRDKGSILGKWLWEMLFRDNADQATGRSKNLAQTFKANKFEPPEMLFVDNVYENAQSVHLALSEFFNMKNLQIPISCYHYVPSCMAAKMNRMDEMSKTTKAKLLQKQMEELCNSARVLSNEEAFEMLRLSSELKDENI